MCYTNIIFLIRVLFIIRTKPSPEGILLKKRYFGLVRFNLTNFTHLTMGGGCRGIELMDHDTYTIELPFSLKRLH